MLAGRNTAQLVECLRPSLKDPDKWLAHKKRLSTGAIHTPTMSDALPYTYDDIATQAMDAAEAGAAILHLHARNPQNGSPSVDVDDFMPFLPGIKQATDAVLSISTGGSLSLPIEDRINPAKMFRPEMCSMNMASMNFSLHPLAGRYSDDDWKFDWEKDYVANSGGNIFRNTFRDIKEAWGQVVRR